MCGDFVLWKQMHRLPLTGRCVQKKSLQRTASGRFYCQKCRKRLVVKGSQNREHCSGNYPFQCCCNCAVSVGWKVWPGMTNRV